MCPAGFCYCALQLRQQVSLRIDPSPAPVCPSVRLAGRPRHKGCLCVTGPGLTGPGSPSYLRRSCIFPKSFYRPQLCVCVRAGDGMRWDGWGSDIQSRLSRLNKKQKTTTKKKEAQREDHFQNQVCFITIVILYCTGIMKSNTVPLCCSQRRLTFLSL